MTEAIGEAFPLPARTNIFCLCIGSVSGVILDFGSVKVYILAFLYIDFICAATVNISQRAKEAIVGIIVKKLILRANFMRVGKIGFDLVLVKLVGI